jgi:putative membrane protein
MLDLIPLGLMLAALTGYGMAVHALRQRGDQWPAARPACMLAGSLCVAAAVLPPVGSHDQFFPVHVAQHLLLGMGAPAFLALSAPITLALRTLRGGPRRLLLRLLHSLPAAILTAPATAVVLDLAGLYALYLTGLYRAAERQEVVHAAVHVHMFLTGCLLSWVIIGIDPARRRPGTTARLAALIAAAAGHDTLAKLMYAWHLPVGAGPLTTRHSGAELMYYGGTLIEVTLAVIVMTQWYLATGRALTRARRRSATPRHRTAPLPISATSNQHPPGCLANQQRRTARHEER